MARKKSKPAENGAEQTTAADEPNPFDAPAGQEENVTGNAEAPADPLLAQKENKTAYFRTLYERNPWWADQRSNDPVIARSRQDHPGETEMSASWKNAMTNVKSEMRSKDAPPEAKTPAPVEEIETEPAPVKPPARSLHELEEQIDLCLMLARQMGGEVMEAIIDQLRKTRNAVIRMTD